MNSIYDLVVKNNLNIYYNISEFNTNFENDFENWNKTYSNLKQNDYLKELEELYNEINLEIKNNSILDCKIVKSHFIDTSNEYELITLKTLLYILENNFKEDYSLLNKKDLSFLEFENYIIDSKTYFQFLPLFDIDCFRINKVLEFDINAIQNFKIGVEKILLTIKSKLNIKSTIKNPYPNLFTGENDSNFIIFKKYLDSNTTTFKDFSFIFQILKAENKIYNIKQSDFTEWAYNNKIIPFSTYQDFNLKGSFTSLNKSSSKIRVNSYESIKDSLN